MFYDFSTWENTKSCILWFLCLACIYVNPFLMYYYIISMKWNISNIERYTSLPWWMMTYDRFEYTESKLNICLNVQNLDFQIKYIAVIIIMYAVIWLHLKAVLRISDYCIDKINFAETCKHLEMKCLIIPVIYLTLILKWSLCSGTASMVIAASLNLSYLSCCMRRWKGYRPYGILFLFMSGFQRSLQQVLQGEWWTHSLIAHLGGGDWVPELLKSEQLAAHII